MANKAEPLTTAMPQWLARVEQCLEGWLPHAPRHSGDFHQAMRYAALGGGKRVRPCLIYATGIATQQDLAQLDGIACAVEMIHVYSLIHDDLPCMDDDDLRRGKPTCHIKFDEATAVLAGDSLQALAFKVLSTDPDMTSDPQIRLNIIETLATASGYQGMAGGQAIDLASVGKNLTLEELEEMHIYKTGALIRASVEMATMNKPELSPGQARNLTHYAESVGLAFQIRDDILDVEGDTETLGKQSGADAALSKPTFPGIIGLAHSKMRLRDLHSEALDALSSFGEEANPLREISDFIVARVN